MRWTRALWVLLTVGLPAWWGCEQPVAPCLLANAHWDPLQDPPNPGIPYKVLYRFRSGTESGECVDPAEDYAGDLYAETYSALDAGSRPVAFVPGEFIRDPTTGEPPDRARSPIIHGQFTSLTPDGAGLCLVEGNDAGQQDLAGTLVTFSMPKVQVVAAGSAIGTEILAETVITRGSCTRTYDALGLWPPVPCSGPSDCDPYPAPSAGRPNGSGISPSIPVECKTTPPLAGWCFFPNVDPAGFPYLTGN